MSKKVKEPTLFTYRVHFEIRGSSYRDVQAYDPDDAEQQVAGDMVYDDDVARAEFESICVDDVRERKTEKPKRKTKK